MGNRKLIWSLLATAIAVILFFKLNGVGYLRQAFYPLEYWSEKRVQAEEQVQFYINQVKACRLEFEKLTLTRGLILRQATLEGLTHQEALDRFSGYMSEARDACALMRELLQAERDNLAVITRNQEPYLLDCASLRSVFELKKQHPQYENLSATDLQKVLQVNLCSPVNYDPFLTSPPRDLLAPKVLQRAPRDLLEGLP